MIYTFLYSNTLTPSQLHHSLFEFSLMGLLEKTIWDQSLISINSHHIHNDEEATHFLQSLFILRKLCPFHPDSLSNYQSTTSDLTLLQSPKFNHIFTFAAQSEPNFVRAQLAFGPNARIPLPEHFTQKTDKEFRLFVMEKISQRFEKFLIFEQTEYVMYLEDFLEEYGMQDLSGCEDVLHDYLVYLFSLIKYQSTHLDFEAEMTHYTGISTHGNFMIGFVDKIAWNSIASLINVRLISLQFLFEIL